MFIDRVKIYLKDGSGGNGCQSLYRDKYMRYPKPDGGDGGKGADVMVLSDNNLSTLYDFKFRQHFVAQDGQHGGGNNRRGRDGAALIIKVPTGTIIKDAQSNSTLRDLDRQGESVIVAKGGEGGSGNHHTRKATLGSKGEERQLILDLKIIADVGLVGFPNAGKSTLISKITRAQPKIAAYPFTTKTPVLGKVVKDDLSFIIADIPGLIEGSHEGRGLGDRFLRHLERTRILIHLIDMAAIDARDPIEDYKILNQELKLYSKELETKPQIIVANKMDLPEAKVNLKKFKAKIRKAVLPISAKEGKGLEELIDAIKKRL